MIVLDNFEYSIRNAIAGRNECWYERVTGDEIDLVYTWVNGSDPALKSSIRLYQHLKQIDQCNEFVKSPFLLVIPELIPRTHSKLVANIPNGRQEWVPVNYEIKNDVSSSLFYFEDLNRGKLIVCSKKTLKISCLYVTKSTNYD